MDVETVIIIIPEFYKNLKKFIVINDMVKLEIRRHSYYKTVINDVIYIMWPTPIYKLSYSIRSLKRLIKGYKNVIMISCHEVDDNNITDELSEHLVDTYAEKLATINNISIISLKESLETEISESEVYPLKYILSHQNDYVIDDMSKAFKKSSLCSIS